ncbi:hypothetical protein SteCoe_8144 [Stentor coeruleus]|uniref:Uncharacterized protein n=1 Tax=Stentor coeruleus TaxID=5963 RepID=A0A1R2CKU6_9CILI|nr:hypothetical protein SteCoe_8144 [Stentor coeruleus]
MEKRKEIIKRLFEELPTIKPKNYKDREAKELFLDQLGTFISSGGRNIMIAYIGSLIFLPMFLRSTPRSFIRFPMILGLLGYHEDIYFFGSQMQLCFNAYHVLDQMKTLNEESLIRKLAESLETSTK